MTVNIIFEGAPLSGKTQLLCKVQALLENEYDVTLKTEHTLAASPKTVKYLKRKLNGL